MMKNLSAKLNYSVLSFIAGFIKPRLVLAMLLTQQIYRIIDYFFFFFA